MADGDVVIDSEFELEAGGTRIELFACEDSSRPGGYRYRFQCYEPDDGTLLRYDNAHEHPTAGTTDIQPTATNPNPSRSTASPTISTGSERR